MSSAGPDHALGSLPDQSLIVFDDFPGASEVLREIMTALIAASPQGVRFLVLSRTRPEFELARLRAAQSLGEIIGDDLRFIDEEVQELFNIVFRMQISPSEAALINGTAEGWPAGLVLMHEYLASLPPSERGMALRDRRAAGFRVHAFDYLAQEVFDRLPESLQQFLVRTSVADVLPEQLMAILTDLPRSSSTRPSVSSLVRDLRNRNLFVQALDEEATVIRYHALFREFLRRKLIARARPLELKKLYTSAADYCRRAGDPVRSVDLLIESGQFSRAVAQIELCGEELIARGQTATFVRWLEALPIAMRNRPWFLYYRAAACRFTDPRTALAFFELALKGFRRQGSRGTSGLMLSLCGIIEACFYTGGNFKRMASAASLAEKLLRTTKRRESKAQARLHLALGIACFFIGRLRQGSEALLEALDSFRASKDFYHQIQSAIYLAPCALYAGDFSTAREAMRKGFEAQAAIPEESGGRAALFLTRAMTALFEGCFAEARECIDQCKSLADTHALEPIGLLSLEIGGWLKIAEGDYAGAERMLSECKQKSEESHNAFFSSSAAHLLAIAHLFQHRLDKAKAESDYALAAQAHSRSRLFHGIYLIASGAIHFKLGKNSRAEKDLTASLKALQQIKAAQQEANAHLVLAQVCEKQGKTDACRKHLEQGFEIGREKRFTYYALFETAELYALADKAQAMGICKEYCTGLMENLSAGRTRPRFRIHCLGGFQVKREQTPVREAEWKSRRAKTLLKMLVAHDGRSVPREQAMDALWPDNESSDLRPAFNSMLHRVRKVLEPEAEAGKDIFCIQQEQDLISLNRERVWTDVGQFQRHVEAARRMKAERNIPKTLAEYEQAATLYQGDFLADDTSADWAVPVREKLRQQYLSLLEDGANTAATSGDRDKALAFYEKLFLADLSHEKACRWLMTRYLSDGRRSEAIRAYERCERALSADLDLEPEEETKKLYRSIIGG